MFALHAREVQQLRVACRHLEEEVVRHAAEVQRLQLESAKKGETLQVAKVSLENRETAYCVFLSHVVLYFHSWDWPFSNSCMTQGHCMQYLPNQTSTYITSFGLEP